jgi:deferrochelatase/peroxidase EfeB
MPVDRSNVQGLILNGYSHAFSCHLLYTFTNNGASVDTKSFFKALYPKVQSAANWGNEKPASMLNIGLTFNGVKMLNVVDEPDLESFPSDFRNGPWSGNAQASLTDVYDPDSFPTKWWNGNGVEVNDKLHCIIHAYALTEKDLTELVDFISTQAAENKLVEIFPLATTTNQGRLYQAIVNNDPSVIHFGYKDGISQPDLGVPGVSGLPTGGDYSNFIIGYAGSSLIQPGPFDNTSAGIFAKDGCYNAFRVMYQDVALFNKFLKDQVAKNAGQLKSLGLNETELEEWFAAKLCGRWRNGSPLMLDPDQPGDPEGENFGYVEADNSDPQAQKTDPNHLISGSMRCPFSAHTRVANPRNQPLDSSEGDTGSPRVIRRGVPYGAPLSSTEDDGVDRGLIGLFLCGSITSQFEKLYGWMNYNNFSDPPAYSISKPPQDALLGNRNAVKSPNFPGLVTSFKIPLSAKESIVIDKLPQFLKTRGTSYCILPSMSSIAKMAGIA